MLSSSNAAVVQATPTFANLRSDPPTATPSLLQDVQEKAHAGLQATVQIVRQHADLVVQAASERVQTARAGKSLLDEGGEVAAQAVVAKSASVAAAEIDRSIASRVEVAIDKLDDSVAKLRMAESAHQAMESTCVSVFNIAAGHEERAAVLRQVARMLDIPASCAQMSAEEIDALAIVQARAECTTLMSKASAGLESVKQKTLASMTPSGKPASTPEDSMAPKGKAACAPELHAAPAPSRTLLEGLRQNAVIGLQNVQQAANARIDTAKAGKKLLDEGGDATAQLVVAKKAVLEAADIDRNIAQRVQSAILKFDVSIAKLRAIQSGQEAGGIISHDNAIRLADEHEARANLFRQIADMLKDPISSVPMNLAEWDALSLVNVKAGCGALQSRTNEGFEAFTSLTFSSCRGGANVEDVRRRLAVCA